MRSTQPQSGPARVDGRFGFTFATIGSMPGLDLVSGRRVAAIGTRAFNSQGPYRDLTSNTATQSFTTPLPPAKYTLLAIFIPQAGITGAFLRTTNDGFRIDFSNTGGGVYCQVTNNGVINGPQLVSGIVFDGTPWVAVTIYDGTTIKSWMQKVGDPNTRVAGTAVGGYIAPTGTLDIGNSTANQGLQALAISPSAASDAAILQLLSDPWQFIKSPQRQLFAATTGGGIAGALASTEDNDTSVAFGSVLVSGALARTEGADSLVASGGPTISGAIAATEGTDTLAAQSGLATSGSLAATEGTDTLVAAGSVKTTGAAAATEGADTVAAAGAVGNAIGGSLAAAEGKDTAAASGGVLVAGALVVTEAGDTLAASGRLQISGSLAAVEAPDTLFASSIPPSPSIILAIYRTTTMDDTDEFGIAPLGSDWSSASTTIFSTDQFSFAAMSGADVCRSGSFL